MWAVYVVAGFSPRSTMGTKTSSLSKRVLSRKGLRLIHIMCGRTEMVFCELRHDSSFPRLSRQGRREIRVSRDLLLHAGPSSLDCVREFRQHGPLTSRRGIQAENRVLAS